MGWLSKDSPVEMSNVDHIPLLVLWSTFSIFSACSLSFLVGLTIYTHRLDVNGNLVLLETIFSVAAATGSILIWTGHALDPNPPYGMCLYNASVCINTFFYKSCSLIAMVPDGAIKCSFYGWSRICTCRKGLGQCDAHMPSQLAQAHRMDNMDTIGDLEGRY